MPSDNPEPSGPSWKEWPASYGDWPHYYLGDQAHQWRNGREGGAWLAGIVNGIPEKCARVEIANEWIAGAVLAMLEGGLAIGPYAKNEGAETFEVWVNFLTWGPERYGDEIYAAPGVTATLEVK